MIFIHDRNGNKLGYGAEVRSIKRKLGWNERFTLAVKYEDVIPRAMELGWTIDEGSITTGLSMTRVIDGRITKIWKCIKFWQCADIVEGYYRNHRPMNFLNDLIEEEEK